MNYQNACLCDQYVEVYAVPPRTGNALRIKSTSHNSYSLNPHISASIKFGGQYKATSPMFTVPARQQIEIKLSTSEETVSGTYELYSVATGNTVLQRGTINGSGSRKFTLTVNAGTYYVKLKSTAYPKGFGQSHWPHSYIQATVTYNA